MQFDIATIGMRVQQVALTMNRTDAYIAENSLEVRAMKENMELLTERMDTVGNKLDRLAGFMENFISGGAISSLHLQK